MTAEAFPRRAWPSARERAWTYQDQLRTIKGEKLRARFLRMISQADFDAWMWLIESLEEPSKDV